MNKRAMVIGILVILLFSAMAMGIHGADVHKNVKERNTSNFGHVVEINGTQYTTHGVIRINSNADFTSTNGVVGGSGTQSDPYIISGWDIDAHGAGDALYIGNTTAYFVVKNSYLHNASSGGITLSNVKNGAVENNNCSNYGAGIYLQSSGNNTISNNNCSNNGDGIYLQSSGNNTISNNNCSNNGYGIEVDWSSNNTISNNNCSNNGYGIEVDWSSNNTISNNTCNNNGYGIEVDWSSNGNTISNDTCSNNGNNGIYLQSSSSNTISSNIFVNNSNYGIFIDSGSSYNRIYNNAFFYNHGSGDTYNSSHVQAYDGGMNNYWNSTTGTGNYWQGWANNNDTNAHNGIVDWPYNIAGSAGAEDYYPLKNTSVKLSPFAPCNLNVTAGNGYVNLSWNAPRGNGTSPITSYRIYRNGVLIDAVPASQLWCNDTNVVGEQNYTYYVTAVNSVGESDKSNEVQATPGQAVPELQAFWLPIIALLLLLRVLRRREKNSN